MCVTQLKIPIGYYSIVKKLSDNITFVGRLGANLKNYSAEPFSLLRSIIKKYQ